MFRTYRLERFLVAVATAALLLAPMAARAGEEAKCPHHSDAAEAEKATNGEHCPLHGEHAAEAKSEKHEDHGKQAHADKAEKTDKAEGEAGGCCAEGKCCGEDAKCCASESNGQCAMNDKKGEEGEKSAGCCTADAKCCNSEACCSQHAEGAAHCSDHR